ncbi:hypothetical protein, partial [Streptococcus pneumoniae]|uniref:hypothetical protein n=1 Tax=Streptococcus pneumoniae TaxID=1313 RepID=UPI00067E5E61
QVNFFWVANFNLKFGIFFEYMIQIVVRSVKDYSENRKFDTEILELRKTYSKMKYGRNNVILEFKLNYNNIVEVSF